METYILSFLDKDQNELHKIEIVAENLEEAKSLALYTESNSKQYDLDKIVAVL
jgi:hypothetical protein